MKKEKSRQIKKSDGLRWRNVAHPKTLLKTRIGTVEEVRREEVVSGKRASFVVFRTPTWVNIIALTKAGTIVMVRQFRHGVRRAVLELPAGAVDAHETVEHAAARELLEETGYRGKNVVVLGDIMPNPALHSSKLVTCLITGATKVGDPQFDANERVAVVEMSPDHVRAAVKRGAVRNALTLAALYLWNVLSE